MTERLRGRRRCVRLLFIACSSSAAARNEKTEEGIDNIIIASVAFLPTLREWFDPLRVKEETGSC